METTTPPKPKVLITGSRGMLGQYLLPLFADCEVKTLGLSPEHDYVCDLTSAIPGLRGEGFHLVLHCAGTEEDNGADALNLEGTKRLVAGFGDDVPEHFLYVSSWQVYGEREAELLDESHHCWTTNEVGRSKALAEDFLMGWAEEKGVVLTILRPAVMFGTGVKGWAQRMFEKVVRGTYVHVRDNEARRSLVTAYDVARCARALYAEGGIYNVADGKDRTLLELAEAMSANGGVHKRMWHLPEKWAKTAAVVEGKWPGKKPFELNMALEDYRRTQTLSGEKAARIVPFTLFDTVEVIARRCPDYPYSEE